MRTLTVATRPPYPVYIGAGLLADTALLAAALSPGTLLVVTDANVGPLHLPTLQRALGARRAAVLELAAGEERKTLGGASLVLDALIGARAGRDATLIALGGGVVGDLAGFAAACFQRGIAWVQVPTTLLAMVDSAVGGKTGVNHAAGKNLIGAFHQPRAVLADLDLLATLPDRDYRAGLAEVIKYGVALDAALLTWLEAHLDLLLAREPAALESAVARCCELKAAIVQADERESGVRAVLNLGHSFGHALETHLGHGQWLHGEAVAVGMVMEARVAQALGRLSAVEVERIVQLLTRAGLPVAPPATATRAALEPLLARDKKSRAGRLRLVLPDGLGHASMVEDPVAQALDAAFAPDPERRAHG